MRNFTWDGEYMKSIQESDQVGRNVERKPDESWNWFDIDESWILTRTNQNSLTAKSHEPEAKSLADARAQVSIIADPSLQTVYCFAIWNAPWPAKDELDDCVEKSLAKKNT